MKYYFLFLVLATVQLISAQDYPKRLVDFEILTLEGEPFTQDSVQKDTYSYFIYFSPNCGHCQDAFKFLNLKAEQVKTANVQIYPVSSNTDKETQKFFKKFASNIQDSNNVHVLIDDDFKFAERYDVASFPTSYLYDQDRNLVKVFEGASEVLFFLNELPK